MELPSSDAGLDRSKPILEFLQRTSASAGFRVVGIHGMPSVGKSTLLNYIWEQLSSREPFCARAHIQIGYNAASQICNLQSSILQQLDGKQLQPTSPSSGQRMLREHFQQLKDKKKPVFLGIDNIFEVENLTELLPFDLSKDSLPASSAIVVTCRNFVVVKALLNICHLSVDSPQVCCFQPPCLNAEESKTLFASCGDLDVIENPELLGSLVPLCKGLPLALTIVGKLFAGNARREREEWEAIKERLRLLDVEDAETAPVTKALQVSYDQLAPSYKEAFLDVVHFYYGWPWERVERILGKKVLNALKDSSLIVEAKDWFTCNKSALRRGFDIDFKHDRRWNFDRDLAVANQWVVTMHDLVLTFGESLDTHLKVTESEYPRSARGLLQKLETPTLRHLVVHADYEGGSALESLEKATGLQTLILERSEERENSYFKSGCHMQARHPSRNESQSVRFLRLDDWKSSKIIMEMKVSSEIRELHLHSCQDVKRLPDTPLYQLEWLSICRCNNFEGFSPSTVQQWHKLKHLKVYGCQSITGIPDELGNLKNLRSVQLYHCSSLSTFPSLCKVERLSDLLIKDCPSLQVLPAMSCALLRLGLVCISIANLTLEDTASVLLEKLTIEDCSELLGLPPAIGNALLLQKLVVSGCESLVDLPDEVGKLAALRELDVSGCKSLKRLPAAIGNASALKRLVLSGCESLVDLPDEVGKLAALTRLDVSWCKSLKRLPAAIGNASALERLVVYGCESLVDLPDEVGKLAR